MYYYTIINCVDLNLINDFKNFLHGGINKHLEQFLKLYFTVNW